MTKNLLIPPPRKLPSPSRLPNQSFISPTPKVNSSLPPLNNNFQFITQYKTACLALVIAPVPFLF